MPTTTPADPYGRTITMTTAGDTTTLRITDPDGTVIALTLPADYPDNLLQGLLLAHRPRFRLSPNRAAKLQALRAQLRETLDLGVTITSGTNTYLVQLDASQQAELAAALAEAHAARAANDATWRYPLYVTRNGQPVTLNLNATQLVATAREIRQARNDLVAAYKAREAATLAATDEQTLASA